jgi:hypothetical protein
MQLMLSLVSCFVGLPPRALAAGPMSYAVLCCLWVYYTGQVHVIFCY